jgi:hypothetical protein
MGLLDYRRRQRWQFEPSARRSLESLDSFESDLTCFRFRDRSNRSLPGSLETLVVGEAQPWELLKTTIPESLISQCIQCKHYINSVATPSVLTPLRRIITSRA